jgi:hypothetical protein
LDEVDIAGQARDRVTSDGPNRKPLTDQLRDHGSADRSEAGNDMEIRAGT